MGKVEKWEAPELAAAAQESELANAKAQLASLQEAYNAKCTEVTELSRGIVRSKPGETLSSLLPPPPMDSVLMAACVENVGACERAQAETFENEEFAKVVCEFYDAILAEYKKRHQ